MAVIQLRYTTTAGEAHGPVSLNARIYYHSSSTTKIVDTTLRQRKFAHILGNHRRYEIIISADQLSDPAKKNFMDAVHIAGKVEISSDGVTWREIIIPGGPQPVTYIQNSKYLPEIAYTVEEAEPVWPS